MAQISFRMDDDLKMSAEDTFKSMGMLKEGGQKSAQGYS